MSLVTAWWNLWLFLSFFIAGFIIVITIKSQFSSSGSLLGWEFSVIYWVWNYFLILFSSPLGFFFSFNGQSFLVIDGYLLNLLANLGILSFFEPHSRIISFHLFSHWNGFLEDIMFTIQHWRGSFSFIFNSHFFFVVLEFFIFFIFIFYLLIILWGIQQIIKSHFSLSFF